ncbi:LOW QUALITY PROTEIN: Hypothetical protein PHPALM_4683 [Phytophthora palmivora]|uniref:Uncharacterized protein n=1 Tax=Phytophthora palmivora TaxID=4796 RepID=A0A2P4YJF2_9STRA|nr:LOW QUALITY PROTEIN: Hypothetical protein PHPALM_4683 [Phytophthora palmivora]
MTKQLFAVEFSPQFIMTDADKAQNKACQTELPSAKILISTCASTWNRLREIIFRDLNDLHFCRTQSEFDVKKDQIIRE